VVGVLFSVVGAFYYLRIVKVMLFDEPTETSSIGGSMLMRAVLSVNALLVLALGVIPGTLLRICQSALQ
jgi:NADH-quinone oxidoreductase subunit N